MAAMKDALGSNSSSVKIDRWGKIQLFFCDTGLGNTRAYRITASSLEYRLFRLNMYQTVRKARILNLSINISRLMRHYEFPLEF